MSDAFERDRTVRSGKAFADFRVLDPKLVSALGSFLEKQRRGERDALPERVSLFSLDEEGFFCCGVCPRYAGEDEALEQPVR